MRMARTSSRAMTLPGQKSWMTSYLPKYAALAATAYAFSSGTSSAGKIEFVGHTATQAPQSMHSSGSM